MTQARPYEVNCIGWCSHSMLLRLGLAAAWYLGRVDSGWVARGRVSFLGTDSTFMRRAKNMAPPGINSPVPEAIHHSVDERLVENVLKCGDAAPDFEVKNPVGQVTSLSRLLEKGPVVLTFYRGAWCPYCAEALRGFQDYLDALHNHGATLLALSPQVAEKIVPTRLRHGLNFELLSDLGNKIARQYGLVFEVDAEARRAHETRNIPLPLYNGDESWELPIPSTYVIGQDATITYAFSDVNVANRADPAAVVSHVGELVA